MLRLILKMSVRDFMTRKSRTFLTILGVAIGIATIVSLVSVTTATKQQVETSLAGLADIMISSSSTFMGGGELNQNYFNYIASFPEVKSSAPVLEKLLFIDGKLSMIYGLDENINSVVKPYFKEGGQVNWSEKQVVSGYAAAQELNLKVGQRIIISRGPGYPGKEFVVVGVLERTGGFIDGGVYIPLQHMQNLTDLNGKINLILVKLKNPNLADEFKDKVREIFPELKVFTPEYIMENINQVISILNAILYAIGSISLLVGATSTAATMITNVMEKTREIGVMKAIGASRRQVLSIFLFQSLLLCILGGIMGVLVSIGISPVLEEQITKFTGVSFTTEFPPELVIGSVALAAAVGLISGFMPAWRAANIQPVEALRYE